MAQFSQGVPPPPPPMMGMHTGRIPSFKNTHGENFQSHCPEPPACVQNAMLTKDKKPFTYTPGGLDLSQIRTPSMARRLNKQQQQQEISENPAYFRQPSYNGGSRGPAMGPPPPPPPPPGPPPPPALVINVTKPTKQANEGERPEIVIPDNPIGMLRKTNSPYHWESELADRIHQGPVPKFVEKSATPSPVAPQMRRPPQQAYQPPPPQQFSQMPPQQYSNAGSPQYQQPISPQYQHPMSPKIQQQNKSPPSSPIWKPEPKYAPASPQSNHSSSSINCKSPVPQNQSPTKLSLQRQDSQFNHSPSPYSTSSSSTTSSSNNTNQSVSPYCETQSSTKTTTPFSSNPASPWRQENRNSPYIQEINNSPASGQQLRSPMSPNNVRSNNESPIVQSPSPRAGYANSPNNQQNSTSWRIQQQSPNIINNEPQVVNGNSIQSPEHNLPARPGFIKSPSPTKQVSPQFINNNISNNEPRYQTHMTIPVTPRNTKQDSVDSPKETLPWVRNENTINKSAPPPPWCQKSPEVARNVSKEPFGNNESPLQPPWVQKQSESRQSLPREVANSSMSPEVQPPWVTENNRRYETLPRAQMNRAPVQNTANNNQSRVIPIQMDVSTQEINKTHPPGTMPSKQQPQLRIVIGMNQQGQPSAHMQGPQQHISRVLTPQLMRMDGASLSSPVHRESPIQQQQQQQQYHQQQQQQQPRTRIIPIQMEPSSPGVTSPSRQN